MFRILILLSNINLQWNKKNTINIMKMIQISSLRLGAILNIKQEIFWENSHAWLKHSKLSLVHV